jgi:UbiD family decarboxylase
MPATAAPPGRETEGTLAYYKDLREHIAALDERGLLVRIKRPIDKDTELMPLVRWQFRGLDPADRKAFIFENVTDAKGRRYDSPVVVGVLAGSRAIYALGMGCGPNDIVDTWTRAQRNPILPRIIRDAPVQEEVHLSQDLDAPGMGFEEFPVPVSTPGYDNAPYFTAACWVTKDPETGEYNVGNYRGQVKSRTRSGCFTHPTQHIGMHWKKAREMGVPLEAALVIGVSPNIAYASITKVPYGVDEFAVAGGLAGEPVELVQAKTVDLLVPAQAEIVYEGHVSTTHLEPEAPFGEYTGYMGHRTMSPFFDLTAVTHRKNAIFQALLSQHTPSEASTMSHVAREVVFYKFLRYDCNIPSVLEVAFQETGGNWQYVVIRMNKQNPAQPWQALNAAAAYDPTTGKVIVVVDEDIDPHDPDNVNWAMSYRMQPHRDVRITGGKASMLDHSLFPPGHSADLNEIYGASAILIDATRKWAYPPVSLPRQEYMERAKQIWEEEGLPTLTPKSPWHGYDLGYWPAEEAYEADLAVRGDHYVTGEKARQQRVAIEDANKAGGWE